MLIHALFFTVLCAYVAGDDPIVTLPNGQIQGTTATTSRQGLTYYAFLGIPYAAPPVGNLRFQAPQPVDDWEGILETKSNGKVCYQTALIHAHDTEDCLYLNVYTPVEPGSDAKLPVLLNIHGGTFRRGSGFTSTDKAQYVIEHDVIVVSINYRLGLFGFLSTLDEVIPGNYGIKDQQFALKWVQQNIQLFGGDPEKVTVMGQSAGSASVTYQLLGAGAQGLFRGAIAQSGSAINTWAYQRNAYETAWGVAQLIDPTIDSTKSTKELLEFLLSLDATTLHNATFTYRTYAPVIEVEHESAMITQNMYEAVQNGDVTKVPVVMGICSEEALSVAASVKKLVKTYDNDPATLKDPDMDIGNEDVSREVGNKIKQIYTNGTFVEDVGKAIQYFGDNRYMKAPIRFADFLSKHTDVYFYQFSYSGAMGNNHELYDGIGKVAHAEDLNYFWAKTNNDLQGKNESDILTLDRYITLLTNFAKYQNPTPEGSSDLLQGIVWPKMTSENFYYLDIDSDLTIQENPREFSYRKWVDIYEEYATKPIISF